MQTNLTESLITNEPSLQNLEKKIEAGLEYFRIAGESLRIIKEKKLYKSEYSTYEDYCHQRWGFSPQYANRLISAASTIRQIEESEPTGSVLPHSESQARILSKSKDPNIAWKSAQEETGKEQPTAKDIEAHLQEKEDKDTFNAEIIEDNNIEAEDTNTVTFLRGMIDIPYEMGSATGRPQVSVGVDDASVTRLKELTKHLNTSKASTVAKSLLLMEKLLEFQDQQTSKTPA
jgi:hypothetical protein